MTEAEWLACGDPSRMPACLEKTSDRKLRLLACACCRRIWNHILDERGRAAVEVAERYAEGQATDEERQIAWEAAWASDLPDDGPRQSCLLAAVHAGYFACHRTKMLYRAANSASDAVFYKTFEATEDEELSHDAEETESASQCSLLRDIFGNPFRPVAYHSAWLIPHVVTLARTIYDERAFDRKPELADALVAAGCKDQDILTHCRSNGPHVRGCWVVDGVLGKE